MTTFDDILHDCHLVFRSNIIKVLYLAADEEVESKQTENLFSRGKNIFLAVDVLDIFAHEKINL